MLTIDRKDVLNAMNIDVLNELNQSLQEFTSNDKIGVIIDGKLASYGPKDQILKENSYSNIWRWQEFFFKENIYKTMLDLIPELNEVSKLNKFNFETYQN